MTRFISGWMRSQKPKIEWKRIPISENSYKLKEKSRRYHYLWNRFLQDSDEELPI
jgi:hypothetical protein